MESTRIPFCVNLSAEAVLMYKGSENFGGKNILAKIEGIVYIKGRRKVFAAFFQF